MGSSTVPYHIDDLVSLLIEGEHADRGVIQQKVHLEYLQEYYLKRLGTGTIVVEKEYVDRDYLEDFAAFYVRCFHAYSRCCRRLHFFSARFTGDAFERFLRGECPDLVTTMKEGYLGFLVARPLPQAVICRDRVVTFTARNNEIQ